MRAFKNYLIAGFLIWAPLIISVWVVVTLVAMFEELLPESLSAKALFGVDVPGMRFLIVLVVLLLTGALTANFIGQAILNRWERLLGRIPLVRSIYNSVKQVGDTVLAPNGEAFRQAVLVEFPRQGAWTIAFVTGAPSGETKQHLQADYVNVYVPTTPNPTSGYFLMVPRSDIVELKMSVDAALKHIVSMGVVAPPPSIPQE
ncbi:DUF502 domain-containing protein [Orrella sp. 11846]|uniref:DUF502 domain-containing protein n=1 Tax=Orrella sp. 11846 TaxID=3409913 RepID=UPI003B5BCE7D